MFNPKLRIRTEGIMDTTTTFMILKNLILKIKRPSRAARMEIVPPSCKSEYVFQSCKANFGFPPLYFKYNQ